MRTLLRDVEGPTKIAVVEVDNWYHVELNWENEGTHVSQCRLARTAGGALDLAAHLAAVRLGKGRWAVAAFITP